MSKNMKRIVLLTAVVAAAAGAYYYLSRKKSMLLAEEEDEDVDFDDFGDDLDEVNESIRVRPSQTESASAEEAEEENAEAASAEEAQTAAFVPLTEASLEEAKDPKVEEFFNDGDEEDEENE